MNYNKDIPQAVTDDARSMLRLSYSQMAITWQRLSQLEAARAWRNMEIGDFKRAAFHQRQSARDARVAMKYLTHAVELLP